MFKDLEKIMRESYAKGDKSDVNYIAVEKSYEYWIESDFMKNSNMAIIFKRIYMSNCSNSSVLCQSMQCNVSERTLFRYRKNFVKTFRYFIDYLQDKDLINVHNLNNRIAYI